MYTESETDTLRNDSLGLLSANTNNLISDHEHLQHVLYINNWYASPNLAIYLHERNTDLCGTVKNWRYVSKIFR